MIELVQEYLLFFFFVTNVFFAVDRKIEENFIQNPENSFKSLTYKSCLKGKERKKKKGEVSQIRKLFFKWNSILLFLFFFCSFFYKRIIDDIFSRKCYSRTKIFLISITKVARTRIRTYTMQRYFFLLALLISLKRIVSA